VRRAALAVAGALVAGAALLAGCPLPQPLPDYPSGSITPPRILTDPLFAGNAAVIFIPANCSTTLKVNVKDTNTIESIEARWFVNYDGRYTERFAIQKRETIQPNGDNTTLVRPVDPFLFEPYQYRETPGSPVTVTGSTPPFTDTGVLRTVELVVSNGFDPDPTSTSAPPNRTPLPGFETQVYRWVFMTTAAVTCPQ
jgi:hypothetical protein